MTREPNILDQLLAGGGNDLLAKAKAAWDSQPTGTKGAVAGGLLAAILGGRGGLGTVAKVGAAAVVGSVASRAYADYKAGKPPLEAVADAIGLPEGVLGAGGAEGDLSARLVRAMIAAANADGKVTAAERRKITEQMALLGFPEEAASLIDAELDGPPDAARIAALATTDEEATQIYTASLLVVNPKGEAEAAWLDALAAR